MRLKILIQHWPVSRWKKVIGPLASHETKACEAFLAVFVALLAVFVVIFLITGVSHFVNDFERNFLCCFFYSIVECEGHLSVVMPLSLRLSKNNRCTMMID